MKPLHAIRVGILSGKKLKAAGFTLVELMVSLVLVSLVSLAVVALYSTTASTYRSNDSIQEIQDTARFLGDVFSQAVKQAGLQDHTQSAYWIGYGAPALAAQVTWNPAWGNGPGGPAVFGANNATIVNPTDVTQLGVDDSGGFNNSDILGVRYFGSSSLAAITTADGSVVDCKGVSQRYPADSVDTAMSMFWIRGTGTADGEPELGCISGGNLSAAVRSSMPIAKGVETLQVMYGINTGGDTAPNRWLNAAQVNTAAVWNQVKMVRIGIVLRGPVGSGVTSVAPLYPLGAEFSNVGGTPSTEVGMAFVPPNDTRLRKVYTYNITLRNNISP